VRSDDPAFVASEYTTERGLEARSSIYGHAGRDARDVVLDELRAVVPRRVLEVGCGWGELAARIQKELGCVVAALDLSPRMVELARGRGVDARVADVQDIPFEDGEFDAVVAAWMLYHVPDLRRCLGEIVRVLRPGGTLVAVTNGVRDLAELWALVGRDLEPRSSTFRAENGESILRGHFGSVRRIDVVGPVSFPDADAIRRYVGSSALGRDLVHSVPDSTPALTATKVVAVLVATDPCRPTPLSAVASETS